jgi:hypothetical protein
VVDYPAPIHFEVFENKNILALTDESHKTISFFSLKNSLDWLIKSAVESGEGVRTGVMPQPLRMHRNFKKITDLRRVCFNGIDGLMIADRTGEIGFINIDNVQHLPEKVEDDYCDNVVQKECKFGMGSFQ